MILIEVLQQARGKIDKPSKWVSYWSQSDDGRRLGADGAIWAVAGWGTELAREAFRVLAKHSGINPSWKDNDRVVYVVPHREVMAMFDKAIEEATHA